ncbi:MAG: virulence factor [Acidimicrobiia bacterium]
MTARLTVIRWREIPAQVVASRGREKARAELSPRFQVAIDRAAMNARLVGTDAYLEQWTRTTVECSEDLDVAARNEADRIESEYDKARLDRLVAGLGKEEGL